MHCLVLDLPSLNIEDVVDAKLATKKNCRYVSYNRMKQPYTQFVCICVYSSGHPIDKVVWCRGRLQRDGNGAAWPQSGGPFQLLLPEVQPKDCPAFGRSDGMTQTLMSSQGH